MNVKGEKIRQLREERGLTLSELGRRADVSISYLSEIERGAKKPSLKMLEQLASALKISKREFVTAEEEAQGLTLGEKLRLIRQDRSISLNDMSKKVDISPSYLSEIERGRVYPSIATIRRISECYGVSPALLLGEGGIMGNKLLALRKEQDITQSALAEKAGISPGMVGQIEHGRVQPSLETVEKIAKALGISPCYFVIDEAGPETMLQMLPFEVRDLLKDHQVQSVLRMICGLGESEIRFVFNIIRSLKEADLTGQDS